MSGQTTDHCKDDLAAMSDKLDEIAREGRRLVSVEYRPPKKAKDGTLSFESGEGWAIISERKD